MQSDAPETATAAGLHQRRLPAWTTSNVVIGTALSVAVAIAFFTTWFMLSPGVEGASRSLLGAMVIANVVILVGLGGLVGFRLWRVWSDRRNHIAGAQTQQQLALMFALVAVVPSLVAFLFTFTILRTSMNDVFSTRIENNINASRTFANNFFNREAKIDSLNLRRIEEGLAGDQLRGIGPATAPIAFRKGIEIEAFSRDLAALYILDDGGQAISRVEFINANYNLPTTADLKAMDAAAKAGREEDIVKFDLSDFEKIDFFRGTLKTPLFGGAYIVIFRPVDAALSADLRAVRSMRDDWNAAKVGRARIEWVFAAGYFVLAIIILFAAVWLALWAATRMVRPIGRLMRMAGRVSSGDLGARVEVYKDDGELGALARSMNHMTAQLQTQRNDLIETNRQFDRRRRFTEAVLSGVSAGVVGVAADGRVTIVNRFAADILRLDRGRQAGARIEEILPELQGLLAEAAADPDREVAEQIEIDRTGRKRTLNVRIVADEMEGEPSYVVTFDDITQLISAQRNAAWGDVARRIAHEIKNPLTPIQLSAERLRRKYIDEIKSQPDIFDKCTETIIRHVNDIGRMVDEFSSFARMPKPVIAREDLGELVKAAVFPQKVTHPEIAFEVRGPESPRFADCDGRLIVQALSNLLKNAAESVSARIGGGDGSQGRVQVAFVDAAEFTRIDVIDNGVGLPKAERHRLTEPYMTTRVKGTGLGLAIVRKVVEEHGGYLEFDDDASLGASGARVSLALPTRTELEAQPPARAAAAE